MKTMKSWMIQYRKNNNKEKTIRLTLDEHLKDTSPSFKWNNLIFNFANIPTICFPYLFLYFLLSLQLFLYSKSIMRTLDHFVHQPNDPQIFKLATKLPLFFQNNLVDPSRVVKYFPNDPQANIRVFYYQYLKLCFQLENIDFESYIRKIQEIINNEDFKFMFYEEDDPEIFNDLQFKQLIMEFFGVLGQGGIEIQEAVNYYPIMDTVFIYFFRALLILTGKTDALDSYIEREVLFQFLCSYFNVEISIHDKCIKFVETDVFVYEEDPKEVYMAYMDDGGNVEETEVENSYDHFEQNPSNILPKIEMINSETVLQNHNPPAPLSQASSNSHREGTEINQSYIASQFVDYTNSSAFNLNSIVKKENLKESGEINPQNNFGKAAIQSKNEYILPKNLYEEIPSYNYTKPKSPEPQYQPPVSTINNNNYYFTQPSTYTQNQYSSYESSSRPPSNPKSNDYSKSQPFHQETPFSKKYEQNYGKKEWEDTPTKDPGFFKYSTLDNAYQTQISSNSSNKYYEGLENKYEIKKPASYAPYEDKYESKKPASSLQPSNTPTQTYTSPYTVNNYSNSYNSITQITSNVNPIKPPSNPSSSSSYKLPTQVQAPPSYQAQAQQYISPSKKNPFNLNVSLQFTNSFTMKVMAQPHRSNVRVIRARARDHRNSLLSFIK